MIRYGFLWSHEQDGGADEAAKDRPCAIIVATRRSVTGETIVVVAPITHTQPIDAADSLEITAAIARKLGLDGGFHWLRLDELNRFAWPGYDLRPVPGKPGSYDYGMLPSHLFEQLRQAILQRQRVKAARMQKRNECADPVNFDMTC